MIALVTGASQGIGAACARALSNAGHRVALVARDEAALRGVADSLAGESLVVPADLLDPGAIDAVFARVEEEWGAVEILVVNAGASMSAPLVRTTDEDWQRMLDLNLTAPFRCLRRALPAMTEAGFGRVVVIASVAGKVGSARIAAYTASKHGVLGLVRTAAVRGGAHRGDRERRLPGLRRHADDRHVGGEHLRRHRSLRGRRPPDPGEPAADRAPRHRRRGRRRPSCCASTTAPSTARDSTSTEERCRADG